MNALSKKLFLSGSYFTIAIRHRRGTILDESDFSPDFLRPANPALWSADPMLAEDDGKTWLFYEAVQQGHGHIEAAEVLDDCSLGSPTVILQDACHYSYPFVFQWQGVWYMIPESSAVREVRLYRAQRFPFDWTLQTVLLRERAVDTTVYEQDGQLYLLTYLTDGQTERVSPEAYQFFLSEQSAELRRIQWPQFNPLRVRGAGPIFAEQGQLYRPAQINQPQRYGDGVQLCRLVGTRDCYVEESAAILKPRLGRYGRLYTDGAHTYCRSSGYEVVDLRCRDFDFWKLPRRLFRRLRI